MNSEVPHISVVLLCYRSKERVIAFVERLKSSLEEYEKDWEIILVGNYLENSDDQTPEVVREISSKDPRMKAVTKVKEGMMGWDMRSGLDVATGWCLAVIDGDGQMPLEDVARVYKKLKEENLDLVKTYRTQRRDGFYRIFLSKVYNFIFCLMFPGLGCRDINSKPKILKREIYEKMELRADDWFADAEIMIEARRLKAKIGELPTTFEKIVSRPSFIKPWAVLEFVFNLIKYRFNEFSRWFK